MGTDGFRGVKAGALESSVAASELVYEFRRAFVECYNWSILGLLEISQAVFADVQETGRGHTVLHDPTESRVYVASLGSKLIEKCHEHDGP